MANDKGRKGRAWFLLAFWAMLLGGVLYLAVTVVGPWQKRERYPLEYEDIIAAQCAEYSLDCHLIASMIYCESSFDPEAVSGVGAVGLMQIMPETAEWIAMRLGERDFKLNSLTAPETSVRFGCYYMSFLLERYNGSYFRAVAAYHCGHGAMDAVLRDFVPEYDGDEPELPGRETKKYVSRVLSAYEIYQELYPDSFSAVRFEKNE